MYSQSPSVGSGWTYGGIAFFAYPRPTPGAVAVNEYYAVQANGDGVRFYYSTGGAGSGWTYAQIAFYALPA